MKIEIDTKEDLHNIRHIIQLLHSISVNGSSKRYESTPSSMFSETPSAPATQTPPSDGNGLFNMFDSSPSSPTPSSDIGIPGIFSEKKDDNSKDFLDSLQVY